MCHGDYHVLDGDQVKEAYKSAVSAAGAPWDDIVKDTSFFGIRSTASVNVNIDGGLVTSCSSAHYPDLSDEAKEWSHGQYQSFLEAKRNQVPQDFPDGSYLFFFGSAVDAPQKFSINLQSKSHEPIERALDVLVADDQEKHLIGKFKGKPLYFIEDARALQAVFRASASVESRFEYESGKASFPKDFWFTYGLGTALEYDDFAQVKLDQLGLNREFGCLILKSDYNSFLRQIRKSVQIDLSKLYPSDAPVAPRVDAFVP